ncbi:helix-turn-helix transcriptional regulator [Haloprofundus halophilus]|uniref:helix-turn-helix transcriptional regulator n=1 Tax=Haloprofundus halophilus TaxID=2283527 RepID=UPI000E45368A|nr:transcriptional regulator [Haloprofundus halophilus]
MNGTSLFEELLQQSYALRRDSLERETGRRRLETDELLDVLRHRELLELLIEGPSDRRDIQTQLGVSRATSHRFTRWLEQQGLAERRDGLWGLTGHGETVAEEVLRFERNLRAAARLEPLLECICPDHKEFIIEPFADAVVTTPTPEDPYKPVERFLSLLENSNTFRGFNTTHMVPPGVGRFYASLFDDTETELIYLPVVVETLRSTHPEQVADAIGHGHLALRTREALPYGLAIFDGRVGIGGYDDETGTMRVFVDTDDGIAREWARRVFEAYRRDSVPLESTVET